MVIPCFRSEYLNSEAYLHLPLLESLRLLVPKNLKSYVLSVIVLFSKPHLTNFVSYNAKEKVLQFVIDNYPNISIEYTKHGNPKPGTLDMCDSIIVALAGDKICLLYTSDAADE